MTIAEQQIDYFLEQLSRPTDGLPREVVLDSLDFWSDELKEEA